MDGSNDAEGAIDFSLSPEDKTRLLSIANESIEHGLRHHRALPINVAEFSFNLQVPRAVFVTLNIHDDLRGCIGTLEADRPLVHNVAYYAYSAAFADPRFPPVTWLEFPRLEIHISILSDLAPLPCDSEDDLRRQVRPGIDGLLLDAGGHRGTLLPSVWEDIPQPAEFIRRLKMKAGLAPDYWSPQLRIQRYTTMQFSRLLE